MHATPIARGSILLAFTMLILTSCGQRARADAARKEAEFWRDVAAGQRRQQAPQRSPKQQQAWDELRDLMAEVPNEEAALARVRELATLADAFAQAKGRRPQSLSEVIDSEQEPLDPWGNRYRLERTNAGASRVRSLGIDGALGSVDDIFAPDPNSDRR